MKCVEFAVAGLVALIAAGCVSEAEQARRAENELIESARVAVAGQLRDPTSPLFSQVEARDNLVCGLVNGKNAFGAYAGDQKFVYNRYGGAELDPPRVRYPDPRAVPPTTICAFDLDYRTCRGEEGLPDVMERCITGIDLVPGDQEVTESVAKTACLSGLQRRFNEDIRPGTLTQRSATARQSHGSWQVRLTWEASGEDFSGLSDTGACVVESSGRTRVHFLND